MKVISKISFNKALILAFLSLIFLGIPAGGVLADGDEILATPSIPIADGTGIVAAGVGLIDGQPGILDIAVPAGTVNQVLLYWVGGIIGPDGSVPNPADDIISVNTNPVTGALIGTTVFVRPGDNDRRESAFRADITNLELLSAGVTNTLNIAGLDFDVNFGAGVVVIFDDGSDSAQIDIRDGLDSAFAPLAPPQDTTVPQLFTFPASVSDRTATLAMFFSSVSGSFYNPCLGHGFMGSGFVCGQ
jgi:hypothetical protein